VVPEHALEALAGAAIDDVEAHDLAAELDLLGACRTAAKPASAAAAAPAITPRRLTKRLVKRAVGRDGTGLRISAVHSEQKQHIKRFSARWNVGKSYQPSPNTSFMP
jgi:hypothetical protein